ncbi:MAG: hypothetical protein LBJ74_00560 [Heliobacteriaceae bacterium]|jgi:hypothetical protein|nr:hypothetical protein [Heliobacteriaceae bacterium]
MSNEIQNNQNIKNLPTNTGATGKNIPAEKDNSQSIFDKSGDGVLNKEDFTQEQLSNKEFAEYIASVSGTQWKKLGLGIMNKLKSFILPEAKVVSPMGPMAFNKELKDLKNADFEYDKQGRLIKLSSEKLAADGQPEETITYEYDENGDKKSTTYKIGSDNDYTQKRLVLDGNNKGKSFSVAYDTAGYIDAYERVDYENDFLVKVMNKDKEKVSITEFKYNDDYTGGTMIITDDDGTKEINIARIEQSEVQGKNVTHLFDDNGKEIKRFNAEDDKSLLYREHEQLK